MNLASKIDIDARIGELLLQDGKLQARQLQRAQRLQTESRQSLRKLLLSLGFVAERDVASALACAMDLPESGADTFADLPEIDGRVSADFLRQSVAIPVTEDGNGIRVCMADPADPYVLEALQLALGKPVEPVVGVETEILEALKSLESGDEHETDALAAGALDASEISPDDIQQLKDLASEAPVIRTVNQLITRALELYASDIHIEPFEAALEVRYRVDGILHKAETLPTASAAAVVSRIKVMANLNIAERRLPQDGRVKVRIEGNEVDLRVSLIPTLYGESVVLRLLDRRGAPLDLVGLGFEGDNLNRLNRILQHPQGILLVTGPTGSGKTTTLYAALETLNSPEKKIITVEDPIEYRLDGVNQIQVRPNIELTFANALRSILRQDPDVIMIGEMRDSETARIAVQSALTGHKVLSTLHTNDAPSSITRLLDMHLEDFLLTATVDGVLAQRLVRKLCEHCRVAYTPDSEIIAERGLERLSGDETPLLYRAPGCEHCGHSGYRGRTTILELLVMSEPIRRAILGKASASEIREVAAAEGMTSMQEDGLRKALAGVTSIEEVERVTQSAQGDH